jgi:hypothetical protein
MNKAKIVLYTTLAMFALVVIYAPVGMFMSDNTNVNLTMEPEVSPKQSKAVAMAMALMQEQLDNGWVPNNPIWFPSAWLDNTPNFQIGILKVEAQFAYSMAQYLGRSRGSSPMDERLDKVQGKMNYDPTVWHYDSSVSAVGLSATSETQYENGIKLYAEYQDSLAKGEATYAIRADNLVSALSQFSNNMGSLTANIESHISTNPNGLTDTKVDDLYFFNKGQAYAYYMILRELGKDYDKTIKEKGQETIWSQMLESLRIVAQLEPMIVFNGDPDTMFLNSHLSSQAFHFLLANKRMKEMMDGLIK